MKLVTFRKFSERVTMGDVYLLCYHSDERHPRPGKRKTDDEERSDEEDLNEANYDEVMIKSGRPEMNTGHVIE